MFTHRLTDEVELRLFEPRHAEELYSVINKNRERLHMMPFVDHVTSIDAEKEFARNSLHQFADGRGFECGVWLYGKLSGGVGMFPIDEHNHSTLLGYWLDEDAEGKGIVTAACREIIDYLFVTMDVNRIVIRTVPVNLRSIAVAHRLGFTYEGNLRQLEVLRGEFVDVEIFSLLKEEWPADTVASRSAFFKYKLDDSIELGLLEPSHTEELFPLVDRNREHLRQWLPWVDGTKSTDDIRAFIMQQLHQLADNGTTVAGIWHCGTLAGTIGLHSIGARCMEIGYWLGEEFQGKGLVTRTCSALINRALNELGINRIEIRVEPRNIRSRAIPERLGFTYEGTLRQKGMNADGKFVDLMMYSLLRDEWEKPNYKL